jgi:NitT/TauT family transport system substrate-binding protein
MKTLLLFLCTTWIGLSAQMLEKITIAGPFASVSHPFFHMIQTQALNDVAKKVEFRLWKNPDELRALILNGDIDFMAVPTNVAANLHNKKQKIQLLNVSVWGILGMISRDNNLTSLKDYKGKTIAVPFRADMPDIIFKELLKAQGLDPKDDFKLQYVSSPIDAMQMLILRRVDHALLAEPAISIALRKTNSFPIKLIAPDLYRSVNLQEEWAKVFNTKAQLPQAGIAVLGETMNKHDIIERFEQEYEKSLQWYKDHPNEAAILTLKNLPMLQKEGVEDSISHINLKFVKAHEAQKEIESFFEVLKKSNPKTIGGKLPENDFYYKRPQ